MLIILLTFFPLLISPIFSALKFNDKRCYDRLAECAQTANILLDVKRINSRIIDEFCFNYTHAIIPCLANKVVKREDFNFFSKSLIHILQHCNSKYNMNYSNTKKMIGFQKIQYLFLYGCAYNNASNFNNTSCFNKLIKYCVKRNPPNHLCFHWQCNKYGKYKMLKKFYSNKKRKRDIFINDTEDFNFLTTNNEFVISKIATKLPYFLRRGTLPLSGIDMRNTDYEDRILDPIRQLTPVTTILNYYLQYIVIILSIIDFYFFS